MVKITGTLTIAWLRSLALFYRAIGSKEKAVCCETVYQYNLATALLKAGEYHKAINTLLKINNNNNLEILDALAYCYGTIEEYDLCIRYYSKAHCLVPDNREILRNLSSAYAKNEQYQEALQVIKEQLGINPEDVDFLNNLAWIYEKISRYHDAEENYHRCLALSPNDPKILYNLICCLQNQNKHHEAIEMAEALKNTSNGYRTAMGLLAQSYEALGCGSIAVDYYNKALGL